MTDRVMGAIEFVDLEHDCDLPESLRLSIGEKATYRWRCPECRQRWFVREDWRSREAFRRGSASRQWRRRRAAELVESALPNVDSVEIPPAHSHQSESAE